MGKSTMALRALVLTGAAALVLSACGGDDGDGDGASPTGSASGSASESSSESGEPTAGESGGTLTFLTSSENLQHLDPQLIYTGEDLAFSSAYWARSLTAYVYSPDEEAAGGLVGDLATDTGTHSEDGKTWSFTLRDGVKWEDGSPVTCEDIKYGVSRTFATDVIQGGPFYAVGLLNIPTDADGNSTYLGPYSKDAKNNTAAFDKAIVCEGSKITFHLSRPAGDFNYTVTLGWGPVKKSADTDPAKYDLHPLSNGPYKITEYTKNSQLVLERNDQWDPATDTYRPAYPDKIIMKFKVESNQLDQRMIASSGEDAFAVSRDALQTANLAPAFADPTTENRRVDVLSPYSRYIGVRADKLTLEQRQAIAVSLDRAGIRTALGGDFAGDLADGVIKPNLAADYAPSGMWTDLLGKEIPDTGDPEYAKELIAKSGKPAPSVTYQYPTGVPTGEVIAGIVKTSVERSGIKVTLDPLPRGDYYTILFDPEKEAELMSLGWGPDWLNAVTIVPELFGAHGGWNLSHSDDPTFEDMIAKGKTELDRDAQSQIWKDANKYAMQQVWAIPTVFEKEQRLAGSKVHSASGPDGNVYLWAPYGSWPYAGMWVGQ